MSFLRNIALCFLVSASAFSLAAAVRSHPGFRGALMTRVQVFDQTIWQPAMTRARAAADTLLAAPTSDARVVLMLAPPTAADERAVARVEILPPVERPGIIGRAPEVLDTPIVIAPTLPAIRLPPERQASAIQIVPVQPAPHRRAPPKRRAVSPRR